MRKDVCDEKELRGMAFYVRQQFSGDSSFSHHFRECSLKSKSVA